VSAAPPHLLSVSSPMAWLWIAFVTVLAIAGEVLIAGGMQQIGDLDDVRAERGMPGAARAVLSNGTFLIGALCMALNFFAMLGMVSQVELSLAAPATASLTFIGNAIAAKFFLHEAVDRRRWLATLFVVLGVLLLKS
jgi:drug/metabolite transporter (DMT)-like permease